MPTNQPDIFDQVAAQQQQPASQPANGSNAAPAQATSSAHSQQPHHDIFDEVAANPDGNSSSQTEPPQDKGFLSGVWDSTVGGLENLGQQIKGYYDQHPNRKWLDTASPAAMLVDAVSDPNHPIHKIVAGIVHSHVETAEKAKASLASALDAAKRGQYQEAGYHLSQVQGYALGTALPVLGPPAVKVGEDLVTPEGKVSPYGAGEATGLIGSVVLPEAVAKGASILKPGKAVIAGTEIPVRASQESRAAQLAENVASTKALGKFDIEQTQPAAREAIGSVASEVPSKAISGQTLPAEATDLADRADQIRAQSQPVFKKLDELTKNDPEQFSELQKQERYARARQDFEAADKARAKQDAIFDKYKSEFSPDDYANARANWRQAAALEDAHDALNSTSVVHESPVDFVRKGQPDPGYINGKMLRRRVLELKKDGVFDDAGIAPKSVQNLQDLGALLEKSSNVHRFNRLWTGAGAMFEGAEAIAHPTTALTAAKFGAGALGASKALGYLMTHPDALSVTVQALRMEPYAAQSGRVSVRPETQEKINRITEAAKLKNAS